MERAILKNEIQKQIRLDKDVARRANEWILKREETYQASGAAAQCNPNLTDYIESLAIDQLKLMEQDLGLNIERPSTKAGGFRSSSPNISGGTGEAPNVPSEVNNNDNDDDYDDEHAEKEEEHSLSSKWKLNPAPKQKPSSLSFPKEDHHAGSTMDIKVRSDQPIANSLNQSVTSQARSYQHPLEQNANRIRGSMSGLAQNEEVEGSQNTTEHASEITDDLPCHGLSHTTPIQHRQQVTTPPGIDHEAEGQNLSHVGRLHVQNVSQPSGSQPPNLPANSTSSTAHSGSTSTGALQSVQNPDLQMFDRELRRGNEPTRCNSCTSLQAENRSLKKSNRCLGQQLEFLRWNSILMDEFIKNLEERVKEQDHDIEENLRVIRFFHEKMVKRRKEIVKLTKEKEILENEKERNKELYEELAKEEKSSIELDQKMKKQTEMFKNVEEKVSAVLHEKQAVKDELRQKGNECNDVERENQLLRAKVEYLTLQNQTLESENKKETLEKQAVQEEYACREAQLNERIIQETDHLLQVYKDLCIYAEEHGLRRHGSTGLNSERE